MARTTEVDAVRSFALFGICVVNVPFLATPMERLLDRATGFDAVAQFTVEWLFQGKFFLLFSFIFGWSFVAMMASAERAGVAPRRRAAKRLVGLALIGIAHAILVFFGDILLLYALLGLVLLALRAATPRTLMLIAACLVVTGIVTLLLLAVVIGDGANAAQTAASANGYLGGFSAATRQRLEDWPLAFMFIAMFNGPLALAAFCAGSAAAKIGFFDAGNATYAALKRQLPNLIGVGLLLNFAYAASVSGLLGQSIGAAIAFSLLAIGGPVFSAAYLVMIVDMSRRLALPDKALAAGRMSLTAYVLEGIIAGLIFNGYGLALYGKVGAFGCLVIAVAIYMATLAASAAWLARFRDGPLEVLLRSITRMGEPAPR